MVSSVSSGMMMPPPPPSSSSSSSSSSLTEDQSSTLTDVLSGYDSENLTEAEAQEIVTALSEAGIEPGAALEEAMSEAGFDAQSVGDLAGVEGPQGAEGMSGVGGMEGGEGGMPPPPPSDSSSVEMSDMVSYMSDLVADKLEASDSTELTEEDLADIQSQVAAEFGLEEGDSLINITV